LSDKASNKVNVWKIFISRKCTLVGSKVSSIGNSPRLLMFLDPLEVDQEFSD
jgi:hypothetical protein